MTETQKRIKAYQEALPGLRERVVAVALLLAMSMAMMTSASFAWLTISRRPEVSGVNTTIASNGNLEIALATGTGVTPPGESQVGDSSAAEGQTVPNSNITWGNLVNLSDPSYGLDNLSLRPAQLNKADLLGSPLYGAEYTADGRISRLTSNFSYTQWIPPAGKTPGYFGLSTGLGVRAISSTKVEAVGAWQTIIALQDDAKSANSMASDQYISLTQKSEYMNSLAYIMGVFMTDRLNASQGDASLTNPTINKEHLGNLVEMYRAFSGVFSTEAEALAKMLNLQLYLKHGGKTGEYTPYTAESLLAATTTQSILNQQGLILSNLDTFRKDYNLIQSDLAVLEKYNNAGTVKWQTPLEEGGRTLKAVIASLVNLNTCTLDGTPISNIGASNASGYLNKSCQAVITNGVLYNFEKRTGAEMEVGEEYNGGKGLKLEATVKRGFAIDGTIYAIITTSAEAPSLFSQDMEKTMQMQTGEFEGTITAEDTYGMAIDVWVRTNAPTSYLTLEGNVLTKTDEVQAMGTDANGNPVELYTLSRSEEVTTEETNEAGEVSSKTETVLHSIDLYKVEKDENGTKTTTWYNASTHATVEVAADENPLLKKEEVVTVLGYEGENRVWSENDLIPSDATTQGSGSCYVYYADTPEDQARSLKLLDAFKVAFVNSEGKLMATAEMDTARFYAESGRVTVPLVLSPTDSINLGEDYEGKVTYGITALEQNVATRITAIIYLDGTKLTNDEVLAAADIQGQLNIQFGSSQALNPINNESLAGKVLQVSARVDKTSFDYDTATGPMTSTVTVRVDGDEPSTVKAFFLRQISPTQGSREQEMIFEKNDAGEWIAQHTFTSPGVYVMRSVELDGISHDLPNTEDSPLPKVTITGFAIQSLVCTQATDNHIRVLSADSSTTIDLRLKFAADKQEKLPGTVQGRFLREDGTAVNINFKLNPSNLEWTGSATFLTSGKYSMQYLVLDGEYVELDENMWLTADLTLGMRVAVYTSSPTSFKYQPSEMTEDQKKLGMQVKILDNAGNEMPGLSGVQLTYAAKGMPQTMNTDLEWKGRYYEGELATLGAGNWSFGLVKVGSNNLTNATVAPIFTIISPEPPAFYAILKEEYQYVPNGGAKLGVQLTNAPTATVEAVLRNTTTNSVYTVLGTMSDQGGQTESGAPINTFNFTLPTGTVNGQTNVQDGNWVMEEVHVRGYYDANGNYISAEKYTEGENKGQYIDNPMVIDLRDKGHISKVVQTVKVTIPEDKSAAFGKDAQGNVTANFMTEHKDAVSGLTVQIVDFENAAIQNVSNITLEFVYGANPLTYGGYSSNDLTQAVGNFQVQLKPDATGKTFVQDGTKPLTYAGTYVCEKLSFTVSGRPYTYTGDADDAENGTKKMPENAPKYEVWSKAPTLKVTGVSPTGNLTLYAGSVSASGGGVMYNDNVTGSNSYTDYYATVYIYATSNYRYQSNLPKVKLQISGMPASGFTATATFPTAASMGDPAVYQFTSNNQAVEKDIGYDEDGWTVVVEDVQPKIYPIGKQTVSQITVNYNSIDFLVDLSNSVTIDQQSCVPYLSFNSTASGQTLPTTPDRMVGQIQDDNTYKVTLPASQTWTENKSSTANQDFTVQPGYPSDRDVYTERSVTSGSGCNATTTTYYTPYIETTTVSVASSSTTTWTRTWTITGWKVGNTTYKPGETITITGKQTVTAVLSYTDGTKTTTSSTTTRTEKVYTKNGDERTSRPNNNKVDSVAYFKEDVVS